jgi:LytS/YehU family sensor histidine kinase
LGNVHTQTDAYLGLATQALYNRQFKQALRLADSALQLLPKDLHHLYRYQALRLKSQALQKLRQTHQATLYADSAQLEAQLFNPQMQINALKQVYEIQKSLGHHKQALMAYEKMSALRDSLSNIAQFNAINELEQRYQGIKKEKSIQQLTHSRKITLLHNQLLLLAIAAALLVILSLVILLRQRSMQAKQVTLEKEQRLNRARMNPHFFFNALVALQVLAMRTNDGRSIAVYLSKFASIMRQILESTYMEYVSLAQEKAFLEKYLELQSLRFPSTFEYTITVADGLDSEHMMLPPMLIQPIAENAIEHGFRQKDRQNKLQIRFIATNTKQLILEVEDNGQGLDQQLEQKKNHLSRASQIIQDTLSILRQRHHCNAHFTIANKPEGGVIAQIFLPLILKAG